MFSLEFRKVKISHQINMNNFHLQSSLADKWDSREESTEEPRTHMFCRAIDSKRSVMEGKDDTEKAK